jgi:putative transposase
VKCAVIARYRGEFPLALMCRVLEVARSTFYAWLHRAPSPRVAQDTRLQVELTAFHRRSGRTYGRPRLLRDLRDAGYRVGHERVRRLMHAAGLVGTPRRKFRVTTQSAPGGASANVLGRQFAVGPRNRAWTADITYCWTREGWLYLAVLLDVGSRRVVGWATSPRLERSLVLGALRHALALRQPSAELLHHSDRGTQYVSLEYQAVLAARGIRVSLSRRGDCWDNAVAESFFATLKRELLQRTTWVTRAAATTALTDYIDGWYNRLRRHSSLGYLSPLQYEQKLMHAA